MGVLIQLTEAAKRLGLTRQTLENWGRHGILHVFTVMKNGKAHYVDEDTINALQDTIQDVARQRDRLETLKREYADELHMIHNIRQKEAERRRYLSICVNEAIRTEFFGVIICILKESGILKEREGNILLARLRGESDDDLAVRYGITCERIRQISEKAIRKSYELKGLKERMERIAKLEAENDSLKRSVAEMKEQFFTESSRVDEVIFDEGMLKLLRSKLTDYPFSSRTINCLATYKTETPNGNSRKPIKTVYDLCTKSKSDLLNQRFFGKKSLQELDDFLHKHGLKWDMEIDIDKPVHKKKHKVIAEHEDLDDWITSEEAAKMLHISRDRLYHIKNHLTHIKMGNSVKSRVLFKKSCLLEDCMNI